MLHMNTIPNKVGSLLAFVPMLVLALVTSVGMTGCEYYRVDPVTGKRYEISQEKYKQGLEEGRDSDAWVQ